MELAETLCREINRENIMVFKVRNYIGPKKMLAVVRKQDMVLEVTRFSNGLDMQEDVRIKSLKMGNL